MVSDFTPKYTVDLHRAVKRFLNKHPDLSDKWYQIVDHIQQNPRMGPHIDHLKGIWHCSYRWNEGSYRVKYDIDDGIGEIHVYDANNRGDIYKGERGVDRRR